MNNDVIQRVRQKGAEMAANSFASADDLKNIAGMSRTQIDQLDYGVIEVESDGKIKLYNKYESELAGVKVSDAEGKNFFKEIAPCTNNSLFFGTFKEGVEKKDLNHFFLYTFTYKMKPTNVNVHLYHDKDTGKNMILVKKK